jgi:hypothetical protein
MATKKQQPNSRWYDGRLPLDELSPSELLAHQIVTQYGDLQPSVVWIMEASIEEDQRHQALVAFHDSLGVIGDPNRDPRQAIINACA